MSFHAAPVTAAAAGVSPVVALIGPEWAPVFNTALLIILASLQARDHRRVQEAEAIAREAKVHARDAKRAAGAARRDDGCDDTGQRRRWTDQETSP